eukprot:330582-Prymnesium_polylepis.1
MGAHAGARSTRSQPTHSAQRPTRETYKQASVTHTRGREGNEARRAVHTAKKLPNKAPSHNATVSRPWQQRCLIWPLAAKHLSLSSYLDASEVVGRGGWPVARPSTSSL